MRMYKDLPQCYRDKVDSQYINYMVTVNEVDKELHKHNQKRTSLIPFPQMKERVKELEYKELSFLEDKISKNLYKRIVGANRIVLSLSEYLSTNSFEQLYRLLAERTNRTADHFNATHLIVSTNLYKRIMVQQEADFKSLHTFSELIGVKVDANLQFRECIVEEGFFVQSDSELYDSFKDHAVTFSIITDGKEKKFKSGFLNKREIKNLQNILHPNNKNPREWKVLSCSYGTQNPDDKMTEATVEKLEWLQRNYDSIKKEINIHSVINANINKTNKKAERKGA